MNSKGKGSGNHCSLIYGSMPPEQKILQKEIFNSRQNGVKFLIATDAIGMGMNLNIQRILFTQLSAMIGKRNHNSSQGQVMKKLKDMQIQQIAGRAGRYFETGTVSAFNEKDLRRIGEALDGLDYCSVEQKKTKKFYKNLNHLRSYRVEDLDQIQIDDEQQIKKACLFPPFQ